MFWKLEEKKKNMEMKFDVCSSYWTCNYFTAFYGTVFVMKILLVVKLDRKSIRSNLKINSFSFEMFHEKKRVFSNALTLCTLSLIMKSKCLPRYNCNNKWSKFINEFYELTEFLGNNHYLYKWIFALISGHFTKKPLTFCS